jgi:hypothetical protein
MYTFAKPRPAAARSIELLPKPVTVFDPIVRFKVDMSRDDISEFMIPPHFTNIQHGAADGAPPAGDPGHAQPADRPDHRRPAHRALRGLVAVHAVPARSADRSGHDARRRDAARGEGITINLFLVPSWSQSEEDIRFAYRLAESTRGRVFFTAGSDLDRYVVWDYHWRIYQEKGFE